MPSSHSPVHAMLSDEARLAWDRYLTPPRYREMARELQLAEAADRSRVRVGDAGVEVYSWGSGAPVLLVHGWGGRGTQYAALIPPLVAAGLRPVAFDAPGHGRGDGLLSSGPLIAAAALESARGLGHLVGVVAHSVGAVATALALRQGLSAARAVLLAPCCWVEPTLDLYADQQGLPATIAAELHRAFRAQYPEENVSADRLVPRPGMPTLLLHDPEDAEIPYAHAEAISATWGLATLEPTPGTGHRRILRSQAVVERIVGFLRHPGATT